MNKRQPGNNFLEFKRLSCRHAAVRAGRRPPDRSGFLASRKHNARQHVFGKERFAMKTLKMVLVGCLLCSLLGFTFAGCEKEGPAEKAGKKMDKAIDSAKKTFKDMTDK
ncbi:hypothetical protein [uncultured Desulfosarcina sp.]|uniref:hypothetical protein n=1 Tax=uncultured Desulfosarcina sp. TaxID=218289 RepID=UPI0029C97B26|nr:hypothetical protein [uncultured Desulfosarcina sp.]